MNENLQQTINEALKALLSSVQQGAAFAKEQMPVVVQEKLMFDFWTSILGVCIAVALLVGSVYWCQYWWSRRTRDYNDWHSPLALFPTITLWILGPVAIGVNSYNAIQIWLAPNLYILEWLRGMIK